MNIFVLGMYRHFDLSTPLILIQEDEKDPKIHYVWIAFDAYYSDITHFIIGLFLELDSDNKIVRKTVQHYRWGVVCSISEVGWFDPREANDAHFVA